MLVCLQDQNYNSPGKVSGGGETFHHPYLPGSAPAPIRPGAPPAGPVPRFTGGDGAAQTGIHYPTGQGYQ